MKGAPFNSKLHPTYVEKNSSMRSFPDDSPPKFEYVKKFEDDERILPGCWFVVRLDGRGFTKFCKTHLFRKPNDPRALKLMNAAAAVVMNSFSDIVIAYGQSDEYSFVFRRQAALFNRRKSKILSCVVSLFSSAYSMYWGSFIHSPPMQVTPSFDARIVLYPTTAHLRDYLSWRQADVHVNNLFNTTFWALVNGGLTPASAEQKLKGTLSGDKNEILFSEFGINYNKEPAMFRKGTIIFRKDDAGDHPERDQSDGSQGANSDKSESEAPDQAPNTPGKLFNGLEVKHEDIIRQPFWDKYPALLHPPDSSPPRIRN